MKNKNCCSQIYSPARQVWLKNTLFFAVCNSDVSTAPDLEQYCSVTAAW